LPKLFALALQNHNGVKVAFVLYFKIGSKCYVWKGVVKYNWSILNYNSAQCSTIVCQATSESAKYGPQSF